MLRTPADYALITRRLLERLAADNVVYAEINVSVGVMLWKQQAVDAVFDAVRDEAQQSPVEVRWIFDAIRQFGADHGMEVAKLAIECRDAGVVAFGIGGDELRGPAEGFYEVFDYARENGLAVIPHAGETVGPESVWAAIRGGARRIGHGIRAVDDPELMVYLREKDIPLEICITSNVCTGAVASLETHPVRRLFDAGVPITLNTDDPGMFGTTAKRRVRARGEPVRVRQRGAACNCKERLPLRAGVFPGRAVVALQQLVRFRIPDDALFLAVPVNASPERAETMPSSAHVGRPVADLDVADRAVCSS